MQKQVKSSKATNQMGNGIRVNVDCSDDDFHDEEVQYNKQNASDGDSSTHNSDSDKDDHICPIKLPQMMKADQNILAKNNPISLALRRDFHHLLLDKREEENSFKAKVLN